MTGLPPSPHVGQWWWTDRGCLPSFQWCLGGQGPLTTLRLPIIPSAACQDWLPSYIAASYWVPSAGWGLTVSQEEGRKPCFPMPGEKEEGVGHAEEGRWRTGKQWAAAM